MEDLPNDLLEEGLYVEEVEGLVAERESESEGVVVG
jgi:hypothetical protein